MATFKIRLLHLNDNKKEFPTVFLCSGMGFHMSAESDALLSLQNLECVLMHFMLCPFWTCLRDTFRFGFIFFHDA